jgi:basic amino acid/polyamine antiporter, APA family
MTELRRSLGAVTTGLLGLGIAVGSGIFRAPGTVVAEIGSMPVVIGLWLFGGLFIVATSLVSAELATRFPKAGGEYVYLREAYGPFCAFFFGWGCTIFIVGGGAGTIAAATGEAAAELLGLPDDAAPKLGALAIVLVAAINALGLAAGAGLQNFLTVLKLIAVVAITVVAFGLEPSAPLPPPSWPSAGSFVAAFLPILWAYEGTTDAVKMAEEVADPAKSLPRALLVSALALIALYLLVNVAYLDALGAEITQAKFAPSLILERSFGALGRRAFSAIALLVFLGALSSTLLATVRVTFALARDGLGFRRLGAMSSGQAPIAAIGFVAAIAMGFTLFRGFSEILDIYYLAAAILYGLSYGSLLVFRARDRRAPPTAPYFRCPGGPALSAGLIGLQLFLAVMIVRDNPKDGLATLGLLGLCALLYLPWRRRAPASKH